MDAAPTAACCYRSRSARDRVCYCLWKSKKDSGHGKLYSWCWTAFMSIFMLACHDVMLSGDDSSRQLRGLSDRDQRDYRRAGGRGAPTRTGGAQGPLRPEILPRFGCICGCERAESGRSPNPPRILSLLRSLRPLGRSRYLRGCLRCRQMKPTPTMSSVTHHTPRHSLVMAI